MSEEPWDSLFVDKYYVMDAENEDLLFDGTKLRNGMEVLIEAPDFREDMMKPLNARAMNGALKYNRWSFVSELQVLPNAVSFIAIYDDGSKRKMDVPRYMAWFVKKHTMPPAEQGLGFETVPILPEFDPSETADMREYFPPNATAVETLEYDAKYPENIQAKHDEYCPDGNLCRNRNCAPGEPYLRNKLQERD
jgi:hypothetical protein